MKVGLYARVSTDEQAKEGYSIGAQCKKLQQYAELNDWDGVLYIDDGYSAKDLNRPQARQLFKDIEAKKIDTVVVYKLDRLTRNVKNLYELMDLFDKNDCKLISLTESLDTSSASGRFFITMLGAMAQWERETIGERTFVGMKEAIKAGKVNGRTPFGYRKVDGKFTIHEQEAEIVRTIFDKYNRGIGVDTIIKDFQKDGLVPIDKPWDATKVFRILESRAYIGDFVVTFRDGEVNINKGVFPPIVSNELFNSANEMLQRKKRLHVRAKGTARLFSGVLTCSKCGGDIFGENPNGLRYKCKNKFKLDGCSCGTFKEEELEREFLKYMRIDFDSMNDSTVGATKNTPTTSKIKLAKELDRIKSIKLKNHTAFENDLISLEDYKKRIQELNEQELEITELMGKLSDIPKIFALKDKDFELMWNSLDRSDKRNMVLKYIRKIIMYKEPKGKTLGKLIINSIEYL
ncbi:recombinase family protein [Turicibacter sanguinis]|uniref:recombinase family protein n=1 Tax=Turicibacter sanguinis TaxID=154288 RepID=UPI0018AA2074|nr:recombinase family protein [Turicibacter sanguinis]MDB8552870.1 recombinase family protein [Turicibacter sanguinis]